eukprot:CAMPEP_0170331064 /NCGR_PEP_ID=MMETSP0116_2-20130129/66496_1 /TAXON_ID=400756 /ORGANISM="Durinskia baltica, Strain CSIRO CS-38" /LENGTH=84 /DNA_ID=CAMNT_0010584295 /DNA_START=13 /DNA_END=265 /DNA_ORIENTATION=+
MTNATTHRPMSTAAAAAAKARNGKAVDERAKRRPAKAGGAAAIGRPTANSRGVGPTRRKARAGAPTLASRARRSASLRMGGVAK